MLFSFQFIHYKAATLRVVPEMEWLDTGHVPAQVLE